MVLRTCSKSVMSSHQQDDAQRKNRRVCVIHEDFEPHMRPDRGRAKRP